MKTLFEGLGSLFTDFLFLPMNFLRSLELENWWLANTLTWIFILICFGATAFWLKQLTIFKKNNDDIQDTTAHSFLS